MIIDFKTGEEIELIVDPNRAAEIQKPGGCSHYYPLLVNEVARTCICKQCGESVDIFTAIIRLIAHYETRVDSRLNAIREFDERERLRRERRKDHRKQSRETLIERKTETLQRAAYNEYQAKLLVIRAERQRAMAERYEKQLGEKTDSA